MGGSLTKDMKETMDKNFKDQKEFMLSSQKMQVRLATPTTTILTCRLKCILRYDEDAMVLVEIHEHKQHSLIMIIILLVCSQYNIQVAVEIRSVVFLGC